MEVRDFHFVFLFFFNLSLSLSLCAPILFSIQALTALHAVYFFFFEEESRNGLTGPDNDPLFPATFVDTTYMKVSEKGGCGAEASQAAPEHLSFVKSRLSFAKRNPAGSGTPTPAKPQCRQAPREASVSPRR